MNFTRRFLLAVSLLLITAHRLPAPITEVSETPTPTPQAPASPTPPPATPVPASPTATPEAQAKPKKNSAKLKAKSSEPESTAKTPARSSSAPASAPKGTAKFSGAWAGTIGQPMGAAKVSLLVNATGTSVTLAGRERPVTVNGNTISWHSGLMDGNTWTLTPNNDGKTAHVVLKGGMGGEWSATFNRGLLAK